MNQANKETILAKSREENKGLDERERQLLTRANTVGLIGLLAVSTVYVAQRGYRIGQHLRK